jgi:hypothetical protein
LIVFEEKIKLRLEHLDPRDGPLTAQQNKVPAFEIGQLHHPGGPHRGSTPERLVQLCNFRDQTHIRDARVLFGVQWDGGSIESFQA